MSRNLTTVTVAILLMLGQSLSQIYPMYQRPQINFKRSKKINPKNLKKEKLKDSLQLGFTFSNGQFTNKGLHLKNDENMPTLNLDLTNSQLLLPFQNFNPQDTSMVQCKVEEKCVKEATQVSFKYSDSICDGFKANGPLEFSAVELASGKCSGFNFD